MADVAFIDNTLHALEAGAGCSHGLKNTVNCVLRVDRNGRTIEVADLSTFIMTHPVAHPNPEDFEPDGTWYSMVPVGELAERVRVQFGGRVHRRTIERVLRPRPKHSLALE